MAAVNRSLLKLTFAIAIVASGTSLQQAFAAINEDHHAKPVTSRVSNRETNQAAQHDLKPIKQATQVEEEDSATIAHAEEHGPVITKPTVVTEPAPGTSHETTTSSPAKGHAPAQATEHEEDHAAANDSHGTTPPAAAASASHAKESTPAVTGEQSLRWLTNGNIRYVKKHFRADGRSESDRKRLTSGQHPHAIVLSCADSRVPPEIVFDQGLGEIFVIRVAGEALDSSVIASVEYAVEHVGSKLLVVMGHTQCGAVKTAIQVKEGDSAGSEALDKLLADIRPRLRTITSEKPSPDFEVESTVNADGVARDLMKRSEIVRKKVESGELLIKPALYRIDTGKVTFY